jgi:erythromycin esterase
MRTSALRSLAATAALLVAACHSAPPPPAPVVAPLSDSASAALAWVQSHAQQFVISDSVANASDRAQIVALAGDARIVGVSELTEGTREFPLVIRRMMFALAGSGFRALVIQAPMAEAMELDRYVRTGTGDLRRILQTLGNWRWANREMIELVNALRQWNRTHPADQQLGLYGFEIPTAAHAVQVVTSLPDSITGPNLKAWLGRELSCVSTSESAHWGLEGRTSDSTFWNQCGVVANAALDSVVALRRRTPASARGASDVAYAEQMARLIQHHVAFSLRHTNRHDSNAEHLMFLANMLGPDAKLLVWGGDVEMGRLTLDKTTVQTGIPLGTRLGARYRAIGFVFGEGVVRTRRLGTGRGGAQPGLSEVLIARPLPNTFEDVFVRTPYAAFWLDARALPTDVAGAWLHGPRPVRLVTESYVPAAPELTETPVELPTYFDALVYVRRVTPARE